MSLEDLIYRNRKKPSGAFATATPATPATHRGVSGLTVATVATVAVAKSRNLEAANDPAPIPADCIGALQSADGGLYLPWGPYLAPDDVHQMRAELIDMIETLADMEHWDAGRRYDVLTRAIRGPLADLLPNLAHFNERLTAARAEAEARAALDRRTWRLEGFDDRRP
ncbi:hypothetical protein RI103_03895 [Paraburkholderia sp. FT54]|uniref:hypothetical protein n=1 Tax=Paraburkholderia sp. FT54 TaxID=3074437 RepID=UPI0028773182|nr:hypothetical protein [Paraburkholderia sp. FT54]WNC90517.1 hypothetical protein RI103_03895 [Paraburkholderia sp. FT54]